MVPWIDVLIAYRLSHKKDLEKLIGNLQRASLAIFPGKAFIRRLERHLYTPGLPYGKIVKLDDFTVKDLVWWRYALIKSTQGIPIDFLLKNRTEDKRKK